MDYQTLQAIANIGIIVGYILIGLALASIIVFAIMQIISNPQRSISALVGLGVLGAIFLISYLSASEVANKGDLSDSMNKMIGGGIIMLYVMGGIAIVTIIIGEIRSLLN